MQPVTFDAASRTWLLRTPATSYVLRLDAGDVPVHLHWGPVLTLEQAAALPSGTRQSSSFDGTGALDELVTEAGARFHTPSLQIVFPGGVRGVDWRFKAHESDGGHLVLRFGDAHEPLELELHYRVHDDSDVIERWTRLVCRVPVTLLRCDSAAWSVPMRDGYRLSHVTGDWSAEHGLHRTELAAGETTLTSRRGLTSHAANPWVMLDAGDATERHGEVWSGALAWSGSWRITVTRDAAGRAGWTGGFGHEGLSWRLEPGEEWVTPVFAGLYSAHGHGGASRTWHDYVSRHVLPEPGELRPVVYNAWEAVGFDVGEANQKELAALAAQVGAELFVMDDAWFGGRTSDRAGLGDWWPNPDRFPGGLAPLIDEVHRHGMRFGLWVEPEMVNPDSDLYRAHPDWVLHQPGRPRTELRHQLVLDLSRPEVAYWAQEWLNRLVSEHEIDFLKWDCNRAFTEVADDRAWIGHVRAVYAILDRLRADHPHLRVEACAGGGGRTDLGILARTDQVWTSDNTDAFDRIAIQHGFSQLYPARVMAAWVTDSPNPLTRRRTPLAFRFHVAMAGALGIGGDLLRWSPEELDQAAALVAVHKDIRPVVQLGVQHRLPYGMQYAHEDRVVVLAWRGPVRHGTPEPRLRLEGLDPLGRYTDEDSGVLHHGAVLMSAGLPLDLPADDYASALVRLRREA
ncbi:alpha-galactosidase [Nonomuraea sediminis]|uniref:alpha-galactosidase n=1 Tax=Nonomuraea sediminis TaxID=2835864 RepID=UPI001BDD23C0|nr:alpha-galactosidase [Nonomuraea sediminis]